jgi:transcriptional regulator with XRE-family HTH domain
MFPQKSYESRSESADAMLRDAAFPARGGVIDRSSPRYRPSRELSALVRKAAGEELAPFVRDTLPIIAARPEFQRGYETLLRIESAARLGDPERYDLGEVRADFALFVRGHILRALGHYGTAIGRILEDDRVGKWIQREQLPLSMYRDDPIRNSCFIKRMEIPSGPSSDFAYILGAYAAGRRPSSESAQVNFQSSSSDLIHGLAEKIERVCGIVVAPRILQTAEGSYHALTSRAREFAEYLTGISRDNTVLPWGHLQTSEERRGFLRGFLDFGSGCVDVSGRFSISRGENRTLVEEVAILLKREGVIPRVRSNGSTTLFLDATVDLLKLLELDVVMRADLRTRLKAASELPSPRFFVSAESYDEVMETARRLGEKDRHSPIEVSRALQANGSMMGGLPVSTLRSWLRSDKVPPSVRRRRELEALEDGLFSPALRSEVGAAILARLDPVPHPFAVVEAVADFLGGERALARAAGVNRGTIQQILRREELPTEAIYRKILSAGGIDLSERIIAGATCPDIRAIREMVKDLPERSFLINYEGAVAVRVRQAFERGEDTLEAALIALRALRSRSERTGGR